ncbi:UNVERIFIED_CONTAM: Serine/threonine-protein kinase ATR [Sesamum latifolium]|uniref:Serine/threonine-protein kinase ATR n=1 Tax=Sesamum latifolium TaxID=2727402 RepID=A0AAW2V0I6_9LAMI
MDSYARAYPFVVKLHLLRELEDFSSLLNGESFLGRRFQLDEAGFLRALQNWESRLKLTQPSLWAREPLLAFRRLVFSASGLRAQVGNCWRQYAKLCRSSGHYETANRAILEAKAIGASNVHIEKAKLLWSTRRADGAIAELQQSLLNMPVEVVGSAAISSITSLSVVPVNPPPLLSDTKSMNENLDVAKTLLLYSRWIHYTGQKQKEDVINLYSRVKELQPKWEKGYFYMAKYCDEVLVDARKRQEDSTEQSVRVIPSNLALVASTSVNSERRWWTYLPDVLLFYAKGLHRGHKNLFQALPRLLTLWFDFGSFYYRSHEHHERVFERLANLSMVDCLASTGFEDLPPNEETVRLVKHIITSVLRQYPQQALWTMAAVTKSTVSSRRDAAAEIIQAARRGSSHGGSNSMFVQFASLVDHLIRLCFHPGQSKARTINILTEFSALKRMMPVDIIMPTQESLTVNLPSYDVNLTDSGTSDIFSYSDLPTITGIADEAEILSSLQRPKKIILMGSDGSERPFLCKPKDDLRKDARMMEFNAMINRLLSKCAESRRRKLYIRTFAVIPLTEDCGMVEWVPHTRGLRQILQDIYISCGKFDRQKTNPQIKRIYDQSQGKMPEDEMLKTKILPMFPPAFHKWFLNTFSEPAMWFRARIAYAHTTAVWSMVGHIVGLGDRHGENILFDSTTGDCVHVDFSCLFDKGLQLEKPELVPFRLTQNMIDGLGITGYEGTYLRVCEIILSILRAHKETLVSVLETFIHDPLVEWTKSHKSSGVEVQNPHAQDLVLRLDILQKLDLHRGCVNTISFNAAGDILVSGSDDRRIILWDWETGQPRLSFHSGHQNNVFQAKIMPYTDDQSIVTCAADGQVRHAQIRDSGVVTKVLAKHHGRVHKLAVEPGSPHIFYTCGEDGLVLHIDLRTGSATRLFTCKPMPSQSYFSTVHLNAITIDPRNPNLFAVGGSDQFARLFDIRLAFSDQSELLVSYNDEFIYLFTKDIGLGPDPTLTCQVSDCSDAGDMTPDNCSGVSLSNVDGNVKAAPQAYKGHRNCETVKGVNFFGPKCEYVVSGSDCGRIFIWKKKGGELVRVMEADKHVVNCIESHPHATVLASSGIEHDIKIWIPKAIDRATLQLTYKRVLNLIPHRIGFFPFGGFYDDDDFTDSADDEDDDDDDYGDDDDDDDDDDGDDDGGNCNNDDITDHDDCYSGNEVLNEEQQEEEEDNEGDDTTDFIFLGYADEDDFGSENFYDDGVEDISETEDDGDIEIAASDDSFGDICDNDYSDLGCDDNDFDDSKTETKGLDAPYGFSRRPDVAVVFPKAKHKP